jgi:hypothetical protein
MVCDITNIFSFSFPFPLSLSSIDQLQCYRHVLHLNLYMIVLVFVYSFVFGSIFPIRGETCLSDPGLLHLTCCPQLHPFTFKVHVIIPCS